MDPSQYETIMDVLKTIELGIVFVAIMSIVNC